MVIASHGIIGGLPRRLISEIAQRAESPVALAHDLCAAAYSYMVPQNLSAIVVALSL
jgi:serine/threonine protein phosphatase PrpC